MTACCTLNRYHTRRHVKSCRFYVPRLQRFITWATGRQTPRVVTDPERTVD